MQLGIVERITLLQILPQQGDFLTLRILHELRQALSFTEQETEEFGLEIDPDKQLVRWNQKATREADIPIGPMAASLVVGTLRDLDKAAKLTENHLSLYEKFCSPTETDQPKEDK